MQNSTGESVEQYFPRKCSWTNRLITSRDRGSVQINIGSVDPKTGLYTGKFTPVALSGYIRSKGEGDLALTELATRLDAASA